MKFHFHRVAIPLYAALLSLALVACAGNEQPRIAMLIAMSPREAFRSQPYVEQAATLQAMPRAEAEKRLRALASSEKNDEDVIILCRLLFVDKDGGPLKRGPSREEFPEVNWLDGYRSRGLLHGMFGLGGTTGLEWPDWPGTVVDGVPFSIASGYGGAFSGPYTTDRMQSFAPDYLDYCLTQGKWTSHGYAPADAGQRQQALRTLLDSPVWERPLTNEEAAYLEYQVTEPPPEPAPRVPPFRPAPWRR